MNKIFLYLQNKQTQIVSAILFVICVAFVVYLHPREAKFKYEFQKGKPWMHENLVAPFDFAIMKSEEEIAKEKEQLRKNKTLFFDRLPEVRQESVNIFNAELQRRVKEIITMAPAEGEADSEDDGEEQEPMVTEENKEAFIKKMTEAGIDILDKSYETGILEPVESGLTQEFGEALITSGGISKPVNLENFFTIREAASFVQENVPFEKETREYSFLSGLIINSLDYNIIFDEATTVNYLQTQIDDILPTRGVVVEGELIIFQGNLVDEDKFAKLSSLRQAYKGSFSTKSSFYYILGGQVLLVSILFTVLYLFLYQFRPKVMRDISRLTFILLNVLLTVGMAYVVLRFGVEYIYLAPFPVLPIIIRSFFDTRLALFVHMVSIILVGFLVPNGFEFVFLQFVAGIFAIILVKDLYKRGQLFFTAAKIIAVYCISYLSLAVIQEGSFEQIDTLKFAYFAGNGLLTLVSFPLIYLQEKLFGFVSDVSLLELSDTNNPLLRELSQKAPGTFQHSLQVANLAEAAVLAINGNALLVRTGALFHDIGKMANPMYFIENQHTGLNPHDELSFEESAQIIIGHVKEGIRMARRHNLPDILIDFIRTHHGTTTVMFFYKQYIKNFPDEEVDLQKFTYPGPKPFSKETATLMMADSVEAASRSLKKPDHDSIDKLVENIIDNQMNSGQFENAEITLKEIKDIKKIFKKMLMNIYHVRIQYPE